MRLADDHHHREPGFVGRQEADERGPHVLRVLALDRDLRRARLAGLVQLEAVDPGGPAGAPLHHLLHHLGHLGRRRRADRLPLGLEHDGVDVRAHPLHHVRRCVLTAVGNHVDRRQHLNHV